MKKWKAKQAWIETAILLVILAGVFLIQQATGGWLDVRDEPLLYGLILGLYWLLRSIFRRFWTQQR